MFHALKFENIEDIRVKEFVSIIKELLKAQSKIDNIELKITTEIEDAFISGKIDVCGKDISKFSEKQWSDFRGKNISMIFQEPMTSLNPMMKVGDQISEVLKIHGLVKSKKDAKSKVITMLDEVGIANPEVRYNSYPHELSGGMRQRVMIAMAVICEPSLLIADEATTALDVGTEAQILKLIKNMCRIHSMSAVVITHNMDVVAEICDYVYVMYMGRIIEHTDVKSLFECPSHPYTRGLLSSIPHIGENPEYLTTIPGNIPELGKELKGCDFCLRCSDDERICFFEKPNERQIAERHFVSCHLRTSEPTQLLESLCNLSIQRTANSSYKDYSLGSSPFCSLYLITY